MTDHRDDRSGRDRQDRDQGTGQRRNRSGHERSAARWRPTDDRQRSQSAPSQRRSLADGARLAAYDTLRQVHDSDAYANLLLPVMLRERGLRGRDAGFATELAYGTLRLQGRYDPIIDLATDRPASAIDTEVRIALRLGAHQLFALRVPDHAAVSETVAVVRERVGVGPAQFTNAILRRLAESPLTAWLEQCVPAETTDPLARLEVTESHPAWIIRAFRESLAFNGHEVTELDALLAADNEPPAVTLVARPGLVDQEQFQENRGLTAGRWSPVAMLGASGDPGGYAEVRRGSVGVQDEGSQLVALCLAAASIEGEADSRWLDLCAGPGGKAALLAALGAERGATLTAVEPIEHRAELVRRATALLSESVTVITGDGRDAVADEAGSFDRVLVDVPCTGLGALRRRPESRWRRQPSDVGQLAGLQRELLGAALDAVRIGGVVAYVTCSPHIGETTLVVDDVLARRAGYHRMDAQAVLDEVVGRPMTGVGRGPDVQLWPHVHGTDAMYLALIRRTG